MAQIFLSYSRVDRRFVEALADKLRRIYGHDNIWFDEGLHGGDIWWEEILQQIAARDIFIYVLSNDSVQSGYCQAEFTEARRLQKQIITVQARDRTRLTDDLSDIHYIDMVNGVDDADALTDLYRSVNKRMTRVPKRAPKPLWEPATSKPGKVDEKPRPQNTPDVETPTLEVPRAERENVGVSSRPWWKKPEFVIGAILVLILAVVLGAVIQNMGNNNSPPDIIDAAQQVLQQQTAQAIIDAATATAARATQVYALQLTESANSTATAAMWTNTPTPDITASIEAVLTEWAEQTAARDAANLTATATLWTRTPTSTPTPTVTNTPTPTVTNTPTPTPTNTPTPTVTITPTLTPIARNADWTPVERDFDGVTMVLVPAGCFDMGSTSSSDEQPVHKQCFDAPFWIDKYEVTQAQFQRLGGTQANASAFTGDNRPVERITWFEARDFCELRDSRLPTEAEWEYAARGPDNLVYPWGNTWNANNAVWDRTIAQGTAPVGSIPAGASWVGALDLSGSVWEWTNSLYEGYPYDASDGREADTGPGTDVQRVVRGGSWFNEYTDNLLSPNRLGSSPGIAHSYRGFRCARSV